MENATQPKKGKFLISLIIQALLAIGIGLAFLLNPDGMVTTSSYIIGIVLIIYGAMESISGFKAKKDYNFGQLVINDGIISIIIGLILIFWPNLGPNMVMIILGAWIIIGGLIQLVIANKFKDNSGSRNVRGVLAIILGVLIIFNPSDSVQLVSMTIGGLSLIYGLFLLFQIIRFGKDK